VAGPVGRTAPWLWPFGGHLPSLEAGSGRLGLRDPGGESPPPWILLALALFLRSSTPRRFRYLPFRGGLLPVGESPRLRPSPALAPRPALRVEAPRVPVQAFGSHSQGDAPSDTTGHQVPRWEPEGTPIRLVSPSGAAAYVPEPSGFPRTAQVSPAYATAIIRVPQPVRPSRPEVPPLAGSYHASTPV
jgi:hypothetical protein